MATMATMATRARGRGRASKEMSLALRPAAGTSSAQAQSEAGADEALVDRAVAHLRRVIVGGQVRATVEAGEYVIREFYGSVESARSRDPRKGASLARLAERAPEFGMSAATLGYVVPVALAVRDLGVSLADDLGISRLRLLTPVKDGEQRRLLAETATSSGWTVEKLRERVKKIRKPHAGGRPEQPAIERAVARLSRVADAEIRDAAGIRAGLDDLTPRRAKALLQSVNRVQANLERVEKLLQRVVARGLAEGSG